MKKIALLLLITSLQLFSQEHFSGLNTSSRVGLLTTNLNPAELANQSNKFEVNIIGMSFNVANNKIGFSDLTSDADLGALIFKGSEPVNLRVDAQIYGAGFSVKHKKWAFGFAVKANGKLDVIDVDTKLGDALVNAAANSIAGSSTVSNNYNQRFNGITWGEIGISGSRTLYDKEKVKINVGTTLKLLFPGSYANMGLDKFTGTITNSAGQVYLNNTQANLNVAYSGGLSNSFTNFEDYSKSVFGGLNGFCGDIGFNIQWKDKPLIDLKKNMNRYKINAGFAIRNIGSMTFKDENNFSTNYVLNIQSKPSAPLGLNLNQFENVDNLQQIETILINQGYLDKTSPEKKDFKVKLPTVLSLYADVKIISKLYVSGHLQQKLNEDNENQQIATQNVFTVTPRINLGFFEAFMPINNNEISGFNTGLGFRLGGFYLGSGSIVTAIINDSKQADFYTGFRWGFL
jgi:hypothetical protein